MRANYEINPFVRAVAPLVANLEIRMRSERGKLSRRSDVAKAMDNMLKRWAAFTRFLEDGQVCLTNNAADRELRGIARAASRGCSLVLIAAASGAAVMYTLIGTTEGSFLASSAISRTNVVGRLRSRREANRFRGCSACATAGITTYTYQAVEARRAQIRNAFSRYIAPRVVQEIIGYGTDVQVAAFFLREPISPRPQYALIGRQPSAQPNPFRSGAHRP